MIGSEGVLIFSVGILMNASLSRRNYLFVSHLRALICEDRGPLFFFVLEKWQEYGGGGSNPYICNVDNYKYVLNSKEKYEKSRPTAGLKT